MNWIKRLFYKKAQKQYAISGVSSSFSKVVIKNNNEVLKILNDTSIIPRTNNLLYVDGKIYQVSSNVFNYDERTIYIWVAGS